MTNPHQFLPAKTESVACPSALSFMVVVYKHFIQWHILTGAQLNENPVYFSYSLPMTRSHSLPMGISTNLVYEGESGDYW